MRCNGRFVLVAVLGLLCACGGGGSTITTTTTLAPANPISSAPSSSTRSIQLGLQPTSATLPVISQITGTLLFPAISTPTTIALSASATASAGVGLESVRRAQSGTLTVYEYFTIVPATSVTLPSIPAITLTFPPSTPLAGKSVYYGISDLNAQGGLVSFTTQGPGTRRAQTVSFAQVPTAITFVSGHKYTFVVYATATTALVGKIYVAYSGGNTVATYNADGTRTTPTITAGLENYPAGIAVDAAGKIYVANSHGGVNGKGTVTTYNADGTQTTPTITAGLDYPKGIAVDAAGKIYVANSGSGDLGTVTTYNADGTQITPTITAGLYSSGGIAVDAAGKIYVANFYSNNVTTYNADGTRTTPMITAGLNYPAGIAVDAAGKIYVANFVGGDGREGTVTTYNADGTQTTPTITAGLAGPISVAVDVAGKIYVANFAGNVTTYNTDGTRTNPTITAGLIKQPAGIVVH